MIAQDNGASYVTPHELTVQTNLQSREYAKIITITVYYRDIGNPTPIYVIVMDMDGLFQCCITFFQEMIKMIAG